MTWRGSESGAGPERILGREAGLGSESGPARWWRGVDPWAQRAGAPPPAAR
jgi:hypothetical protein